MPYAVRGFGGAHARRLHDQIGRRYDTASLLVCSTPPGVHPGRPAPGGDYPEIYPCKRGRVPTLPEADIPAFLPMVMKFK